MGDIVGVGIGVGLLDGGLVGMEYSPVLAHVLGLSMCACHFHSRHSGGVGSVGNDGQ